MLEITKHRMKCDVMYWMEYTFLFSNRVCFGPVLNRRPTRNFRGLRYFHDKEAPFLNREAPTKGTPVLNFLGNFLSSNVLHIRESEGLHVHLK